MGTRCALSHVPVGRQERAGIVQVRASSAKELCQGADAAAPELPWWDDGSEGKLSQWEGDVSRQELSQRRNAISSEMWDRSLLAVSERSLSLVPQGPRCGSPVGTEVAAQAVPAPASASPSLQSPTEAEPAAAAPAGAAEEEPLELLLSQGEDLGDQELLPGEDDVSSCSGEEPVGSWKDEESSQLCPSPCDEELSQAEEAMELSPGESNTKPEMSKEEEAIKDMPEDSTSDEELSSVEEDLEVISEDTMSYQELSSLEEDSEASSEDSMSGQELSSVEEDLEVIPEDTTSYQELSSLEEDIEDTPEDNSSDEELSSVEEDLEVIPEDTTSYQELASIEEDSEASSEESMSGQELSSVEEDLEVIPEDTTSYQELSSVEEDLEVIPEDNSIDKELSSVEEDIEDTAEDSTSDQELSSVEEDSEVSPGDGTREEKLSPLEENIVVVSGDNSTDEELPKVKEAIELGPEDSTALPPEGPSSASPVGTEEAAEAAPALPSSSPAPGRPTEAEPAAAARGGAAEEAAAGSVLAVPERMYDSNEEMKFWQFMDDLERFLFGDPELSQEVSVCERCMEEDPPHTENGTGTKPLAPEEDEWDAMSVMELLPEEDKDQKWKVFGADGLPVPVPQEAWAECPAQEPCSQGPAPAPHSPPGPCPAPLGFPAPGERPQWAGAQSELAQEGSQEALPWDSDWDASSEDEEGEIESELSQWTDCSLEEVIRLEDVVSSSFWDFLGATVGPEKEEDSQACPAEGPRCGSPVGTEEAAEAAPALPSASPGPGRATEAEPAAAARAGAAEEAAAGAAPAPHSPPGPCPAPLGFPAPGEQPQWAGAGSELAGPRLFLGSSRETSPFSSEPCSERDIYSEREEEEGEVKSLLSLLWADSPLEEVSQLAAPALASASPAPGCPTEAEPAAAARGGAAQEVLPGAAQARKRPSRFRRALRALRGLFRCPCLRPRPEE